MPIASVGLMFRNREHPRSLSELRPRHGDYMCLARPTPMQAARAPTRDMSIASVGLIPRKREHRRPLGELDVSYAHHARVEVRTKRIVFKC